MSPPSDDAGAGPFGRSDRTEEIASLPHETAHVGIDETARHTGQTHEEHGAPAAPSPAAKEKHPLAGVGSFFKELPVLVLLAFGLALLIKTFFVQAFYIPSESMLPTLRISDRVLVNKLAYRFRDPRRGEIVVFVGERVPGPPRNLLQRVRDAVTSGLGGTQPKERDFIKRVIGLPGETVETREGAVWITPAGGGQETRLDEPYIEKLKDLTPFGPFVVPAGSYFVMGDNRPNSSDSRSSLGPIRKSDIVGRAFVRIWPPSRAALLTRPGYAAGLVVLPPIVALRRRRAA